MQNYEQLVNIYQGIFVGCGIAAIVFFAGAAALFFLLKIPRVFGELTGRTAKKAIREMEGGGESGELTSESQRIGDDGRRHRGRNKRTGSLGTTRLRNSRSLTGGSKGLSGGSKGLGAASSGLGSRRTTRTGTAAASAENLSSGSLNTPQLNLSQQSGFGQNGADWQSVQAGFSQGTVQQDGVEGTNVLEQGAEGTTVLEQGAEGTTVLEQGAEDTTVAATSAESTLGASEGESSGDTAETALIPENSEAKPDTLDRTLDAADQTVDAANRTVDAAASEFAAIGETETLSPQMLEALMAKDRAKTDETEASTENGQNEAPIEKRSPAGFKIIRSIVEVHADEIVDG